MIKGVEPAALRSSKTELFDSIADRDKGEKLWIAVESLPLKLRTAVVLKYVEGLTYSGICDVMGCARGVLQRRLNQASRKLREILD